MNLETEDANLALMITPQDHSVDNVGDGEAVPMSDPVEVEQGEDPSLNHQWNLSTPGADHF